MATNTCFIMMPFDDKFRSYYEHVFAPSARKANLVPVKVDEIYTPTQISFDIMEQIRNARIIIADVSGKNPNVNYELGIAHALGKKTIIVTQNPDDVPFDYRHIRYIMYDTSYAGWDSKLLDSIYQSLTNTLSMNSPTSVLAGENLDNLFSFLSDTALDFAYEVSKVSKLFSDEQGNCLIEQNWTVRARSDMTHMLHGVVCDEPGAIKLLRAYDKSNGDSLRTLTTIGNAQHVRYVMFFNKTLKAGETIQFDLSFEAENYLNHLFSKGVITMFQRANTKRNVFYNERHDIYNLPKNDFTETLAAKFNQSAKNETCKIDFEGDRLVIDVSLRWNTPYSGLYSYEISG